MDDEKFLTQESEHGPVPLRGRMVLDVSMTAAGQAIGSTRNIIHSPTDAKKIHAGLLGLLNQSTVALAEMLDMEPNELAAELREMSTTAFHHSVEMAEPGDDSTGGRLDLGG